MKRTQTVVIAAFGVCAIAFVTFTAIGSEDEADPFFGMADLPRIPRLEVHLGGSRGRKPQ